MKTVDVPKRLDFVSTSELIKELGRRHTCGVVMMVKPSRTTSAAEMSVNIISPNVEEETTPQERLQIASYIVATGMKYLDEQSLPTGDDDDE